MKNNELLTDNIEDKSNIYELFNILKTKNNDNTQYSDYSDYSDYSENLDNSENSDKSTDTLDSESNFDLLDKYSAKSDFTLNKINNSSFNTFSLEKNDKVSLFFALNNIKNFIKIFFSIFKNFFIIFYNLLLKLNNYLIKTNNKENYKENNNKKIFNKETNINNKLPKFILNNKFNKYESTNLIDEINMISEPVKYFNPAKIVKNFSKQKNKKKIIISNSSSYNDLTDLTDSECKLSPIINESLIEFAGINPHKKNIYKISKKTNYCDTELMNEIYNVVNN